MKNINGASQSLLASHGTTRHATLAAVEQEDQLVLCIDDVTGKELAWSEVRQAREQELTHLRDFGV